jgi:hypothetical protein
MASYFQRILTNVVGTQSNSNYNRHLPMINSIMSNLSGYLNEHGQIGKKRALMSWYKTIPELTGFIEKVAGDSMGRFHFEPVKPSESNRNRIMRANKFAQEVCLGKTMESEAVDELVTGDGFGWIGKIPVEVYKESIRKQLSKKYHIESKELADDFYSKMFESKQVNGGFEDTTYIDEDILRPRKYRSLASTTVEIQYDNYDVLGYRHVVGVNFTDFKTDEVVHYNWKSRDGKIEGFSPVESVILQLELLRQMWRNLLSVQVNGGIPDKIITLEDVNPNTEAYKRFKEDFQKYKLVENRHGSLLFTGKVNVQDLQQVDEMQFKESGLYITGLIALQWGIPRSSIPYIVGGTNTKDDTGGNSERGYWEVIRRFQMRKSETMNTQLWIPYFGVKIVFENPYFQLDVQMETAKQLKFNNVKLITDLLRVNKKKLKDESLLRELNMTDEDIEEIPEEDLMIGINPKSTMNSQLSQGQVNNSDSKNNKDDKKKQEQDSTIESRGKPTGVGKESVQKDPIVETKEIYEDESVKFIVKSSQ